MLSEGAGLPEWLVVRGGLRSARSDTDALHGIIGRECIRACRLLCNKLSCVPQLLLVGV